MARLGWYGRKAQLNFRQRSLIRLYYICSGALVVPHKSCSDSLYTKVSVFAVNALMLLAAAIESMSMSKSGLQE